MTRKGEIKQGKLEHIRLEIWVSDLGDLGVRASASPETNKSPGLGEDFGDQHIDD